jgi:DNA-binding NarL/FixJ family response regulator
MQDTLVLNANDGTSRGAVFTLPRTDGQRARRGHAAIERLLPHVSAALRIRRGLQTTTPSMAGAPHGAELVLDVDGAVRDGEASSSAKELLRHAVTTRDRARMRQADPDAALEAWTALVDGRWSLLDVFERGGRRYVVAVPNVPDVLSATRLGPLERAVFGLLARGRANKAIGYELGLSEGTVAGYIRDLRRKLGHEAVRASARASVSEVVPVPLDATEVLAIVCDETPERVARLSRLSSAERAVVGLAVAGQSDKQIAARRAVSPRTVSNQLRSAYQKLGVGSRRGLRAIV